MSAKKKSCFQITSVTQAQVATLGCADDSESLDDPDESRTEDTTSVIYEAEVCERRSSAMHGALISVGESEAAAQRAQAGQSHQPGGPGAAGGPGQQASTSCSSRFRVIKLDHGTGEPFRRGRWTCTEFYEREPEAVAGRTADGTRHVTEHAPDRDSGLGASVVVQSVQASDATFTTTVMDLVASHNSVHLFESSSDPSKTAQPGAQALLGSGLNQTSNVQISPVTPQAYPTQPPQNPQLPIGLHMPSQTSVMAEYGQQHLPHSVPMQGEISISVSASQSGASIPNLIDWAGVVSGARIAPLNPTPSVQLGQYSGVVMTAGQNSPVLSAVGIPVPEQSRRKSDAAVTASLIASVKDTGKPFITEELPLIPNTGVNSLFGIPIPIDGDEDSASGASVVAIDNKIEKAMDLVKSHLMYAVREEVEVLKEQIKELCERNSVLERENAVLKSLANSEQLSQLSTHTVTSPAQTPASNPLQPSVSSA